MSRLPAIAFAVLVAATVFAFFETQHLKSGNTVVGGNLTPYPAAFNPVNGQTSCPSKTGAPINYRTTSLTVQPPKGGTFAVYVINRSGGTVATVSSGRSVPSDKPSTFYWNGRETDGQIAPDGDYYFKVELVQQGRTVVLPNAISLETHPPHPTITSVALDSQPHARVKGPVVVTPGQDKIYVRFPVHNYRRVSINVWRTGKGGSSKPVITFTANPTVDHGVWGVNVQNGSLAPAGTYLVGITAQDQACNSATYPATVPPSAGTTPHTGVTVRYLAATPPLVPTVAGSTASVPVDSPVGAFNWELRLAGKRRMLESGTGAAGSSTLAVPMPKGSAGLYTLTLTSGVYKTSIPLVASAPGLKGTRAKVLVVLPMLTWQGQNQVDDTGDGLPSTLGAGDSVELNQPLSGGLPSGYLSDVALLHYLSGEHVSFQLTTDVALAQNIGPSLDDRDGVLLAGSETWLPATLVTELTGFVKGGANVLSIGTDALRGTSQISGYPSAPVAAAPVNSNKDIFGATHGYLLSTRGDLITELTDELNIFSSVPTLPGFTHFTPIEPPARATASLAGIATGAPAVAAFKDSKGTVVEIGLAGFSASLARNVNSQELLQTVWHLLSKAPSH